MTANCMLPMRFRLMLLSVVLIVTGIQPKAMNSSAEDAYTQQPKDTPSAVVSQSQSRNEERALMTSPENGVFSKLAEVFPKPPILEKAASRLPGKKTASSLFDMEREAVLYLSRAIDKVKAVSGLFHDLGIGHRTGNVFGNPHYKAWSSAIHSVYPDEADKLIFSHLKSYFFDDLVEKLAIAKKTDDTKEIGCHFESMLIDTWISESNDPKTNLLQNPFLRKWYQVTPDVFKKSAAIELRLRLHENGVDDVKSFVAKGYVAGAIFEELHLAEPHELEFRRLKLHIAVDIKDLFRSSNFKVWKAFVAAKQVDFGEALLFPLRERSLSEHQLLKELFALGKSAKDDRGEVQNALVREWIRRGDGVAMVLKRLELDKSDGQFFHSPMREVFDAYMLKRDMTDDDVRVLIATWISNSKENVDDLLKYPWLLKWSAYKFTKRGDVTSNFLLDELKKYFKSDRLANILESASVEDNVFIKEIGWRLLPLFWKRNNKSAEALFKKLKPETVDDLMADPILYPLLRFMPDSDAFVKLLLANLPEGGTAAELLGGSKDFSWIASEVKGYLLSEWKAKQRTAFEALKELGLNKKIDIASMGPATELWVEYVISRSKRPDLEIATAMLAAYGENLKSVVKRFGNSYIQDAVERYV